VLKVTLRSLLSHKLRLALTAIAIVLGVSFVAGTLIITDTINGIFGNIFSTADQGVAVVVQGQVPPGGNSFSSQRRPFAVTVLAPVQHVSGVKRAVGLIFRDGADLIGADGKVVGGNQGPPHFGANWVDDTTLAPYHFHSGGPPRAADDVVIDATTATTGKISVGQAVFVVFNGGSKRPFTVSGVVGYGSANNLAGASILLFRLDTIQSAFDARGEYDAIDATGQPGVSATELRDRVAAAVPPGVEVATGAQVASQSTDAARSIINTFIGTPLLVFAIISLFVGSFLIVNTFTILVTQRTRELALLRALGATRRQVLVSVLVEAALTGLVMSAAGALVGILLAKGLYAVLDTIGFGLPAGDLQLQVRTFIVAIALGTIVTLGAAILPARRATRVAPVAALREAEPEIAAVSRRRIITGGVVTALGAGLLGLGLFGSTGQTLQLLGVGSLILFVGVAVLAPLLVQPVALVLGAPAAALRGVPGRLAQANARRSPRRTASTAAALMIGVALVAGVDIIAESIKVSSQAAVAGSLPAQVIVSSNGTPLSTEVATALRRAPSLTDVAEVRSADILVGSSSQSAFAIDPAALGRTVNFDAATGDVGGALQSGGFIVDTSAAATNGWVVGSTIPMLFSQSGKTVKLRLGATYRANALLSGITISLSTFNANVQHVKDFVVLANGAPGVAAAPAEGAAVAALQTFPTATVQSRDQFEKAQEDQITLLQNVIFILLFLAIIIAFFGIVNTLALSIIERTRELGLLRAMGMTRRQMRSMVRWEAVIISLLGGVLGMVVGVGLGVAVVRALGDAGIGHLGVPAVQLGVCLVVALILGVLAAVVPAFRAGRLNMLRAIATD
jgi:putative ABC transport system permease protein